jgi:truncated hemoglobin YjbI
MGRTPSAISGSIYERLGGEEGVKTLVDKLFAKIDADTTLGPKFT